MRTVSSLRFIITATLASLLGMELGLFLFTGDSIRQAHLTSNEGIFIPREELEATDLPQWQKGDARYIIVLQPREDLPVLIDKMMRLKDPVQQSILASQIAAVLQQNEFSEAVDILNRNPSASKPGLREFFLQWAKVDPRLAMEKLATLAIPDKGSHRAAILKRWIVFDEFEAFSFLKTLPDGADKRGLFITALTRVAQRSPREAVEMIQANPFLDHKETWQSIVTAVSQKSHQEAFEIALLISPGEKQNAVLHQFLGEWAQKNDGVAITAIKRRLDRKAQAEALSAVIFRLEDRSRSAEIFLRELPEFPELAGDVKQFTALFAYESHEKAIEWVNKLPPGAAKNLATGALISAIGSEDPEKALNLTIQLSAQKPADIVHIIDTWIHRDPSSAMNWIDKKVDFLGPEKLTTLISSVSQHHPEEALKLVSFLPVGSMQIKAIFTPALDFTITNPAAAKSYLNALPEGPFKQTFYSGYLSGISKENPLEAAKLIRQLPEGEYRQFAVRYAANEWAIRDPKSAADWALEVEHELLPSSLFDVIKTWARKDHTQAREWINQLPPSVARDALTSTMAETLIRREPALAIEYASSIQDPSERNRTLESAVQSWLKKDREAAKDWVEKSSLPEKLKQSLLR